VGLCGHAPSQLSVYISWLELFHQEAFAADEAMAQTERGQGRVRAVLVREAVKELDPCI
jgi:hypothetical protein